MLMGRGVVALAGLLVTSTSLFAQAVDPGRRAFEARCARCHGADGSGGEMGPAIAERLSPLDDQQLMKLIREGQPLKGMPPNVVPDAEMADLVKFLRTIERTGERPLVRMSVQTTDGRTLDGHVLGEGFDDLQLQTDDKRVHLLRRAGDRYRPVTSETPLADLQRRPGRQPLHDAHADRQDDRVAAGAEVDVDHTRRRSAAGDAGRRRRHHVRDGAERMLRARRRQRPADLAPEAAAHEGNRGRRRESRRRGRGRARLHGHRQRAPSRAEPVHRRGPLGHGARGLAQELRGVVRAAACRQPDRLRRLRRRARRERLRRRVRSGRPARRSGGSGPCRSRASRDPKRGRGRTSSTAARRPGSPAATTPRSTWSTGRPAIRAKEYNGDDRQGDNLYASSILALDRKTGTLKWHYQFTPHDLWDWDATQTSVLVDADWEGQPRQLMLHAIAQRLLLRVRSSRRQAAARQAVRQEPDVGERHRRRRPARSGCRTRSRRPPAPRSVRRRTARPTGSRRRSTRRPGSTTCRPSRSAASTRRAQQGPWESGKSYLGGSQKTATDPKPQRILKAIDIHTGAIKWELPQPGPAQSWGGTLATATGLVIFGEDGGALMAADAVTGQAAVELPDEPELEGLADDLHVRREAVHRRRGRLHDHRAGRSRVSGQGAP